MHRTCSDGQNPSAKVPSSRGQVSEIARANPDAEAPHLEVLGITLTLRPFEARSVLFLDGLKGRPKDTESGFEGVLEWHARLAESSGGLHLVGFTLQSIET